MMTINKVASMKLAYLCAHNIKTDPEGILVFRPGECPLEQGYQVSKNKKQQRCSLT